MKPAVSAVFGVFLLGCSANARFDLSGKPSESPSTPANVPASTPTTENRDVLGWSAKSPNLQSFGDSQVLVVRDGDTLYSIAKRHGVTVDMIYSANGLRNDQLTPGQHLIIPQGSVVLPDSAPAADNL
jgi:LysM repeat protein